MRAENTLGTTARRPTLGRAREAAMARQSECYASPYCPFLPEERAIKKPYPILKHPASPKRGHERRALIKMISANYNLYDFYPQSSMTLSNLRCLLGSGCQPGSVR